MKMVRFQWINSKVFTRRNDLGFNVYGNNEIGNRLPIAEVGAILKNHSAIFQMQIQAYGSEVILPHELGIDLLSISAHKINGPKGQVFFKKRCNQLPPFYMVGNKKKRRAGHEKLGMEWHGYCRFITSAEKQAKKKTAYQVFKRLF